MIIENENAEEPIMEVDNIESSEEDSEIDEDQHLKELMEKLNRMRKRKEKCDIVIKVGSEEIHAHKHILAAGSSYFKDLLIPGNVKNNTKVIHGADPDCVEKCIDFIYTGIPPKLDDDIEPLMCAARLLELPKIYEEIIKILHSQVNLENYFNVLRLAKLHDLESLVKRCESFIIQNFFSIFKTFQFAHFDKKLIEKVLQLRITPSQDERKLDAILRWVKFDEDTREKHLDQMLRFISLQKIPPKCLSDLARNEPLIYENGNRLQMFSMSTVEVHVPVPIQSVPIQSVSSEEHDIIFIFDRNSGFLQKFNPEENTLVQMQKMNDEILTEPFTAVSCGKYIYVLTKNKTVYRVLYTDKESKWEQMKNFTDDHGERPPAVVLQNCIYVIGGRRDSPTKSVEKYIISLDKWEKLPDIPRALERFELTVFDEDIYFCGGISNHKCSEVVERFDPEISAWTTTASMNKKKAEVSSCVYDKKLFVLGGFTKEGQNENSITTVELYDPQNNIWTFFEKSMLTPRSCFRSFVINGEIYAVGGNETSTESIEKYNFERNEWKYVEILEEKDLDIMESVML